MYHFLHKGKCCVCALFIPMLDLHCSFSVLAATKWGSKIHRSEVKFSINHIPWDYTKLFICGWLWRVSKLLLLCKNTQKRVLISRFSYFCSLRDVCKCALSQAIWRFVTIYLICAVNGFVVKVSHSLHYLKCLTLQDTFEGLVWAFFRPFLLACEVFQNKLQLFKYTSHLK